MRSRPIALVLASGTLASINAVQPSPPAGDKYLSLQKHDESGLATNLKTSAKYTRTTQSPQAVENKKGICHSGGQWWPLLLHPRRRNRRDDDGDSDSEDDCDESSSYISPPPTSQLTLTPIATSIGITNTNSVSSATPTSTVTVTQSNTAAATATFYSEGGDKGGDSSLDQSSRDNDKPLKIGLGVVGALLALFLALLIWYWIVIRPRRRARLSEQRLASAKDADLESHVTVDLRNGVHTPPHELGSSNSNSSSSSDGISSLALSPVPAVPGYPAVESMPPSPPAAAYPAVQRGPMASSVAIEAYAATPRSAYGPTPPRHPQTYSPTGSPIFPSPNVPPTLQIGTAHTICPSGVAGTAELDGQPPPPQYPGGMEMGVTMASSSSPQGTDPTSPLPVSPLSVASPHEALAHSTGPVTAVTESPQHHHHAQGQQYKRAPGEPRYETYDAPTSLPEVVSPICQLGQTSASLPEYDESAEAVAWSGGGGMNNPGNFAHRHHNYEGDEKQALQQNMSRY
ncbi:hypothetical protein F5Y03DRAFT_256936 [Xylaria venustula]|nr:hypothetical protein F5Y03DRAFT_256936 [Xylaria venustula]